MADMPAPPPPTRRWTWGVVPGVVFAVVGIVSAGVAFSAVLPGGPYVPELLWLPAALVVPLAGAWAIVMSRSRPPEWRWLGMNHEKTHTRQRRWAIALGVVGFAAAAVAAASVAHGYSGQPDQHGGRYYIVNGGTRQLVSRAKYEAAVRLEQRLFGGGSAAVLLVMTAVTLHPTVGFRRD